MALTLKQLKYFVTASELNSTTKAAELLHISQPSISSAISQLEDHLGLQLFIRHHAQGITITPSGKLFLKRAKKLLIEANDLETYAKTLSEDIAGKLKLASFPTLASSFIAPIIYNFKQSYPHLSITCNELTQEDIISDILQSKYEFAITYDLEIPPAITFEPLLELPPYVLISSSFETSCPEKISVAELKSIPMVLLDWPMTKNYFHSLFIHLGIEPNITYRVQSINMALELVSNNLGFTILNAPIDNYSTLNKLTKIYIDDELPSLRLGIVKNPQIKLSPASHEFISEFKAEMLKHNKVVNLNDDKTQA